MPVDTPVPPSGTDEQGDMSGQTQRGPSPRLGEVQQ